MRKYRIIVVENDEDEQHFMKEGFEATGMFEVLAFLRNGDELQEWLGNNRGSLPEFVLSDLNMPGKNGYDIIAELRADARYAHIPVVITSTSSTQSIMQKCRELGAAEYIVKPDIFIEYLPFIKRLHQLVEEKKLVS